MSDLDEFLKSIKDGVAKLARDTFKDAAKNAEDDVELFLKDAKSDLERWAKQLAADQITMQQFRNLADGQKSLLVMNALTQAGTAKVELDKFRRQVIDIVIEAAFKVFLP